MHLHQTDLSDASYRPRRHTLFTPLTSINRGFSDETMVLLVSSLLNDTRIYSLLHKQHVIQEDLHDFGQRGGTRWRPVYQNVNILAHVSFGVSLDDTLYSASGVEWSRHFVGFETCRVEKDVGLLKLRGVVGVVMWNALFGPA
jgi:hypothetical protein